jgi:hypothetical protein
MSVIREAATGRSQPLILYDQYNTGALTGANTAAGIAGNAAVRIVALCTCGTAVDVLDRFKVNIII